LITSVTNENDITLQSRYQQLRAAAAESSGNFPYKRAVFRTRLPHHRLYTASHYWLEPTEEMDTWRIGLTRFATRMLGEMVELDFETELQTHIEVGKIVGWMEGFKATTDLYAVLEGSFEGSNPDIEEDPARVHADSYGRGWLYLAKGEPEPDAMSVEDYAKVLDATIDKMLGEGYAEA